MKKLFLLAFMFSIMSCSKTSWYDKGHVSKDNPGTFIVSGSIFIINAEVVAGTNENKDSTAYWVRYDLVINNQVRNQYYYPVPDNVGSINYWKIVVDELESQYKSGVTKPIIKQYPIKPKEPDNLKSI